MRVKDSFPEKEKASMIRIIFLALIITLVSFFSVETVFSQTTGVSLEAEIQNIERAIAAEGIPAAERQEGLVRLARLRQLSGDIEGAARNWLEATTAIPGRVDDDALLACAYCLAAMGEWDGAATALEPLLSKNERARFLYFSIRAIQTGNTTALAAIADNAEYSEMKSEILFVLWRISQDDSGEIWRQRLIAEFPQTPEGRLAASAASTVVVRPSPFWLFAGGLDSLPVLAATSTPASGTSNLTQAPVSQPPATAVTQTPVSQSSVRLQTGIFGREVNAQSHAANLRQAGFSPSIEQRFVNGSEMWAVTVPAGTDQTGSINQLRAAGFDSFPVR